MNSDQFFFDDTDEEEEVNNRHGTHDRLVAAYFAEQPIYTPKQFRERFRLRRKLFNRIVQDLNDAYPYFQQNIDAVGRCGISSLVKCTSTIPQLAYDSSPDSLDEYLQIGTKTARDCLVNFCNGVMEGDSRSNNDINVIRQSPLLNDLKEGKAPEVAFVANDDVVHEEKKKLTEESNYTIIIFKFGLWSLKSEFVSKDFDGFRVLSMHKVLKVIASLSLVLREQVGLLLEKS
ncbi:putative nuclease HARBI1 [Tanacetum coccineum]